MERFRFGEQEGPNGRKTTLNGFLAVFGAGERCHFEIAGPNGGVRAMAVFDKATAGKVGAALLGWAMPDNRVLRDRLGDLLAAAEAVRTVIQTTGGPEAGYYPGSLSDPRD